MTLIQAQVLETFELIYDSILPTDQTFYAESLTHYPNEFEVGDTLIPTYPQDNKITITTTGFDDDYFIYDYDAGSAIPDYITESVEFDSGTVISDSGFEYASLTLGFGFDWGTQEIQSMEHAYQVIDEDDAGRPATQLEGVSSITGSIDTAESSVHTYFYVDESSLRLESSVEILEAASYSLGGGSVTSTETTYTYDYGERSDSEISSVEDYDIRYGQSSTLGSDKVAYSKDVNQEVGNFSSSMQSLVTSDEVTGDSPVEIYSSSSSLNIVNSSGTVSFSSISTTDDTDFDGGIEYYSESKSVNSSNGNTFEWTMNLFSSAGDDVVDDASIVIVRANSNWSSMTEYSYDGLTLEISQSLDTDGDSVYDYSSTQSFEGVSPNLFNMPEDHLFGIVDVIDPAFI